MRKLVCLALALICCLNAFALAAPSITTKDMLTFKPKSGFEFKVNEDEKHKALCQEELKKLAACENVVEYFALDDDNAAKLDEIMGEGEYEVNEFCPITIDSYAGGTEPEVIEMKFMTPYPEGEKVAVAIGIKDKTTGLITWTLFEGIGLANGGVKVEFSPEILQAMQDNDALRAVISPKK